MSTPWIEDFQYRTNATLRKGDDLALDGMIEELSRETRVDGQINPRQELLTFQTWGLVYTSFLTGGKPTQAAAVGLHWCEQLNREQQKREERFHKGGAYHNTALAFWHSNNRERAFWMFLCAFIEDVQSGLKPEFIPPSPATNALRVLFNMPDGPLLSVVAAAFRIRDIGDFQWAYPEASIVEFLRRGEYQKPASRFDVDIPLNRFFAEYLFERLDAKVDKNKGTTLEFLAAYLFATMPNVRLQSRVQVSKKGGTYEHEIDVLVTQSGVGSTYLIDALGRHFLVECKDWNRTVGTSELNHFVSKMRFHGCHCGVIVCKKGLSGDADAGSGLLYARISQLRWFHQDGCVVIVVNEDIIKELIAGAYSFTEALTKGYHGARFSLS
jgi:hypothetical protein